MFNCTYNMTITNITKAVNIKTNINKPHPSNKKISLKLKVTNFNYVILCLK